MDVGFLGLGRMGSAMARNLMKGGHRLTVWNRSPKAVDELVAAGAAGREPRASCSTRSSSTTTRCTASVPSTCVSRDSCRRLPRHSSSVRAAPDAADDRAAETSLRSLGQLTPQDFGPVAFLFSGDADGGELLTEQD